MKKKKENKKTESCNKRNPANITRNTLEYYKTKTQRVVLECGRGFAVPERGVVCGGLPPPTGTRIGRASSESI